MTSFWDTLKQHAAERVGDAAGAKVMPEDFVQPPRPELGDMAYGCFKLSKVLGANPAEVAKTIVGKFGSGDHLIEGVSADGPFLNIRFNKGEFIHRVIRDIEMNGATPGASTGGKGKSLMLEYAQPNTHKEMHVGHLRNLVLGSSLVKLLMNDGWKVVAASYHGDVGSHVAKCLWWMVERSRAEGGSKGAKKEKKSTKAETASEALGLTLSEVDALLAGIAKKDHTGRYLGELYSEATRELEADEEKKDVISSVQRALESHDPVWTKLWLETRRWSLDEMAELFDELGVQIDRQYLESEVVEEGQRIVDSLLEKGVAKVSEGAVVVDLEDKKMGVFLIRKSDGTSLYATKDLALAYLKHREYPKLDRSILLVDDRQSLYFRQLFETLKMMGYGVPTEHVGYEFVTLKGGAMSSREGNVVTFQSFRDEVLKKTREETLKRHADWNEGQVTYTAWAVALAGIKFGMLRQDATKVFTFDLDQALSFDGDTGPYVQYTVVRMQSILKKAGSPDICGKDEPDCRVLKHPSEVALAKALVRLGDVLPRAAQELRPSLVAQWCIETAQLANDFYRDVKVLEGPKEEQMARLRLVTSTIVVLRRGLDMIGIPVPEEM